MLWIVVALTSEGNFVEIVHPTGSTWIDNPDEEELAEYMNHPKADVYDRR